MAGIAKIKNEMFLVFVLKAKLTSVIIKQGIVQIWINKQLYHINDY